MARPTYSGDRQRIGSNRDGRDNLKPVLAMIVVGLSPRHLGASTPRLAALARDGGMAPLGAVTPAITCSVQASFMTGLDPSGHGVVGNGWLFRDQMEVLLWRQSNRLVGGEKVWEAGKRRDRLLPAPTCSGGTTWRQAMTSAPPRGRSTRPTVESCRIAIPRRPNCATS